MKSIQVFTIALITASSLYSCSNSAENQKAMPPANVKVVKAIEKDLPIYKEFVGQIYGYKDIPIRARVEGFLESIDFKEGSYIKKGQLLYTIDSQPFQADVAAAKSNVAEAEVMLVNAENELARYKPLAETKAVSQSDVDAAQATRDAAEASLNAARANLEMSEINLSYASMRSPINGIIGITKAKVGEYVGKDPNPVILNTVSRLDTVRVQFFLTESQYLTISKLYIAQKDITDSSAVQDDATTKISLKLSDGSTYKHLGKVDFIDRNVTQSTGAILVQSSFPNPDQLLRPGLYAKVKIMFANDKKSIVIPQRAVKEVQGTYSVMVVTDSNTVEARTVKMGARVKDYCQITDGISAGETIVFEGLQKARSGAHVNPEVVPFSVEL